MKHLLWILLVLTSGVAQLYAGWSDTTFNFDGSQRQYKTYISPNYDPSKPASLIVVLHGLGGSMNDVADVGITNIADTANIILLSPQALDFNSPLGLIAAAWNSGVAVDIPGFGTIAVNPNIDDVGFVKAILDITLTNYSVNHSRVYVCGASMGGFLTQRLACEAADRFAAAASVMGTYAIALPSCNPGKVLPVAHFHGTNDEVVSYNGELIYAGNTFQVGLSVDSLISKWVNNNDCGTVPLHENWPDANGDGLSVDHYTYSDANARSRVELFRVNGGNHFWYQNSNTGGELDYTLEIWKFFNKQYGYSQGMNVADINPDIAQVRVYPNPADEKLFLSTGMKISTVVITDVLGKVVLSQKHAATATIDISTLHSGIYFIKIQGPEGNTVVKKIRKR